MKELLNIIWGILLVSTVKAQQEINIQQFELLEAGKRTEWSVNALRLSPETPVLTDSIAFTKGKNDIVHFGGERKYIYARINNLFNEGDSINLIIDNFNIDSISLFYREKGSWKELSKKPPYSVATKTSRAHVFRFPDPKGEPIYIRLISRNSVVLPFILSTDKGLLSFVQRKHLTETLMLGAAILLIFFNLLYFLWTKERNHLYFLFYNTTLVFYSFFYLRGYAVLLPVATSEFLTEYAYSLGATANLAAVLFSRDFLKPYPNRKWIEAILHVFIAYLILIILCNAIGYRQVSGVLLVLSGILTPFMISLNASFPAREGHNAAKALLIGWLIAGVGMFIYSLSIASKIPFHWITMALLPLSTTLVDLLVLTYAVAIRQIKLTQEKDQWKEMLLKNMDERQRELEEQVDERTSSLRESNQLLQESNAVKNRMISLITHDLKMPLVNLQAILDLLTGNLLTVEQSQRKLNDVKHSLGEISGLLENLLLWSKQQQKNIRTRISPLDLSRIIEDTTPFVRLLFTQKDMTVQIAVEKKTVHADAFQLETILRNLLYNAGQNAAGGSVIRIGQMKIHDRFCVFVENQGQTLTVEAFEQLMQQAELFRNEINQLHTGIGLQLCAEFLLNHGSNLQLESNDRFTRFYFYLPEPS